MVSFLGHSCPPLPGIAFPDLAQHWTRMEGEFWVSLSKSNILLGLFHANIVSLSNFSDWMYKPEFIQLQNIIQQDI